ncbi:MAG: hypothetical protein J4F36_02160 [Nitrosopumilaceae archaeon]|nr:hypothetical protein [Nitrosopumilaceae archaeon]
MPHVVFDQKIDLKKFYTSFEKIIQDKPIIIKIQDVFIDKSEQTLLLPTLVIESTNQHFLIEINAKDNKTTLRLFPETDPEKTIGVKTAMGLLTISILETFPSIKITKTNISDFIPDRK